MNQTILNELDKLSKEAVTLADAMQGVLKRLQLINKEIIREREVCLLKKTIDEQENIPLEEQLSSNKTLQQVFQEIQNRPVSFEEIDLSDFEMDNQQEDETKEEYVKRRLQEIYGKQPNLSKAKIARIIAEELGMKWLTIYTSSRYLGQVKLPTRKIAKEYNSDKIYYRENKTYFKRKTFKPRTKGVNNKSNFIIVNTQALKPFSFGKKITPSNLKFLEDLNNGSKGDLYTLAVRIKDKFYGLVIRTDKVKSAISRHCYSTSKLLKTVCGNYNTLLENEKVINDLRKFSDKTGLSGFYDIENSPIFILCLKRIEE